MPRYLNWKESAYDEADYDGIETEMWLTVVLTMWRRLIIQSVRFHVGGSRVTTRYNSLIMKLAVTAASNQR